eukprot:COSAG06_NODE_1342_length_9772_cov_4.167819_7_plen_62_part_00
MRLHETGRHETGLTCAGTVLSASDMVVGVAVGAVGGSWGPERCCKHLQRSGVRRIQLMTEN